MLIQRRQRQLPGQRRLSFRRLMDRVRAITLSWRAWRDKTETDTLDWTELFGFPREWIRRRISLSICSTRDCDASWSDVQNDTVLRSTHAESVRLLSICWKESAIRISDNLFFFAKTRLATSCNNLIGTAVRNPVFLSFWSWFNSNVSFYRDTPW